MRAWYQPDAMSLTADTRANVNDGRHRVHNHGPEDGPGLACPEHVTSDGRLRGRCLCPHERTIIEQLLCDPDVTVTCVACHATWTEPRLLDPFDD